MNELTRLPTALSGSAAVAGAIVAVIAAGVGSIYGLAIGISGLAILAFGLTRGHRDAVDIGSLAIFGGVIVSGLQGESVELTVLATIGAVLAWDLAQDATDLGEQLGRDAETKRLEAVHIVSSLLIGLVAATLGYGVYIFASDGQPVAGIVLLVLAAAFLVLALGSSHRRNDWKGRNR